MLIEAPQGPIKINGTESISDFRINCENGKARVKFNKLVPTTTPVDILISDMHPSVKGLSLQISMRVLDVINRRQMEMIIGYDFSKKTWKLTTTDMRSQTYSTVLEVIVAMFSAMM